jgi:hypothetical protein
MAFGKYDTDNEKGKESQQLYCLQSRDVVYDLQPAQTVTLCIGNALMPQ